MRHRLVPLFGDRSSDLGLTESVLLTSHAVAVEYLVRSSPLVHLQQDGALRYAADIIGRDALI